MINKKKIKEKASSLVRELKEKGMLSYDTDISRIVRESINKLGIERAVIGLNSSGCSYKKKSEGCFHCGHLKEYENPEKMFQEFVEDVKQFEGRDEIFVYSNGSFLDIDEISIKIQKEILEYLVKLEFKKIIIESRPDFVNEEHLDELLKIIDNNQLYIGLGFDTFDDEIRELCLNKGFQRADYDDAIKILNKYNIAFETRVVVKPPFITEKESIDEAINTVKYAFNSSSSSVSLEPLALQRYTLQEYLSNKGAYKVPWLWSLISIVKSTYNLGKLLISGENFVPLPYETAHNCDDCTSKIKRVIYQFNKTQQFELLNNLNCSCKEQWKKDLAKKEVNLYDRILNQIK